ncbi:TonB family protein [Hoylesella buccalis]|uniref:energy transducer TonB n=1 Tax=Hoylesella buccalis TaxID=28127 RepID=UPI0039925708
MSKIDLISGEWTELVFAGRNQAYGAYQLRKGTGKRNVISIIAVVALVLLCQIGLSLKKAADAEARKRAAMTEVVELSKLEQPKKKAEVKQQKKIQVEPEKVVERVKSSIKFTAPVIKKDNEVKPEEELKTQDELMKTKTAIGAIDVKGNDDKGGEVLKLKEAVAQPEPKPEVENKVFDVVEQMPSFPGGPSALMKYLSENVKYPVVAQENGVQGRVVVSFVVEKDGHITDVKVVRSVDPSLDKEAARVVRSMPSWIPGKQNGSAVRVKYNVPVSFKLQ